MPRAPCMHTAYCCSIRFCIIVQLAIGHMLSMTFTYVYEASRVHEQKAQWHVYAYIVGMVNGHGCDGQLKYTICDVCRPCHSILSILIQKLVYRQLQQSICCTYKWLRCLKIWRFFVDDDNNNNTTDYFTPRACARGNYHRIIPIPSSWLVNLKTIRDCQA